MEANDGAPAEQPALAELFSDLVRLETELWAVVDHTLQRDHDLPLSWFEPMQVMDLVPECRVADIAHALSITLGGTSKLIDRIQAAGWCTRTPNPADARSSLLTLTRAGRRRFAAARLSFEHELECRLGAAVPPEELTAFAATIRAVRCHLSDEHGTR